MEKGFEGAIYVLAFHLASAKRRFGGFIATRAARAPFSILTSGQVKVDQSTSRTETTEAEAGKTAIAEDELLDCERKFTEIANNVPREKTTVENSRFDGTSKNPG